MQNFGRKLKNIKIKNIFAKGCSQNWFEEVSLIKEVKNIVPWTCGISDLNVEEIIGAFYQNELRKISKTIQNRKK